jgi:enoyl-[acyl-carrier-protein] reductase (NADH)
MEMCIFLYYTLAKDLLCPSFVTGTSNKEAISFSTASRTKSAKAKMVITGLNSKSAIKYRTQITLIRNSSSLSSES